MPVKKFLVIAMAVMCVVSCMCMTALAAGVAAPPYESVIQNGTEFKTLNNFGGQPPYFEVVPGVEYTITADMNFALQWWDGDSWEYWPEYNSVQSPTTIVFDESIQYVAISSHGYTSNIATCTISWHNPGLMDYLSLAASAIWSQIIIIGTTIVETPVLLFTIGFLFAGGCVAIFGRLLRKN